MNAAARVSNLTNSTDPQAINSRVFVGNLNTFIVTKEDVERLFKRYGRIVAISMHKGYAFVQYTNTIEARNSVVGEDGRMIANQILDVNMVSEPKPHQTGRKRHCLLTTAATTDWDLYYEGYPLPRIVPPLKRSRIDFLTTVRLQKPKFKGLKNSKYQPPPNATNTALQTSCQDTLICGTCKEMFSDLQKMIEHKKVACRLRFSCKCQDYANINNDTSSEKSVEHVSYYTCYACKEKFPSALEIIEHAHLAHDMKIVDVQEMVENHKYDKDGDQLISDIEDDISNTQNGILDHEDRLDGSELPSSDTQNFEVQETPCVNGKSQIADEEVPFQASVNGSCSPNEEGESSIEN